MAAIMKLMPGKLLPAVSLLLVWGTFGAEDAKGAEFRIATEVWTNEDKPDLIGSNLTLFGAGVVYDFVNDPPRVAVFKQAESRESGHFALLDPASQRRTKVTMAEIDALMAKLRSWSARQQDPLIQFGLNPEFRERRNGQTLELLHATVQYRILLQESGDQEVLTQYRTFTNAYTQLNAVLAPSARLPAIRLAVNEALHRHRSLPLRVELTIPPQGRARPEKIAWVANHDIIWRISREDRLRLEQVNRQLVDFEEIPFRDFVKPSERVASTQ